VTPQLQKYRTREQAEADGTHGDCYRTCLAMVLDVDRDAVPHFMGDVPPGTPTDDPRHIESVQAERAWLREHHDVVPVCTAFDPARMDLHDIAGQFHAHSPDVAAILMCSLGGPANHVVVSYGGRLYDPLGDVDPASYRPCIDGLWWAIVLAKATKPLRGNEPPVTVAQQEAI